MQELKKTQKNMTIPNKLKTTQEMKNLQSQLKSIQVDKQLRQAQLESLQEGEEYMLTEIDVTEGQIEQVSLKSGEQFKEHITSQNVKII